MKLTPRFDAALAYASIVHHRQTRKQSRIPYISHLLIVAGEVLDHGGDEEQAIAALLHDAAEDQGGRERLEDIRDRFGGRVARIVEACTDTMRQPKPEWTRRKRRYIARLATVPREALLVIAADKLANVRSIAEGFREGGERFWDRFNGKRDGTRWYFRAAADAIARRGRTRIAGELARAVRELETLAARRK